MQDNKRGWLAGFFIGLWKALNFTRLLVFNILFLILLIAFFVSLSGGSAKLQEHTALVLNPKGSIVEQYTSQPAQRALAGALGDRVKEVQLRDIVQSIDAAALDQRIERMVIIPDEIESAGISTLREIGAAIERFKQHGKEVVAMSNGMSQGQYLLAVHADEILLHPDSPDGVLLTGFASYRSYYKDALDWLGVNVHLFRVGEYKSYAEPYIRNDESPEAKQADLYWMNGIWATYLSEVATARKLDVTQLSAQIDNASEVVKSAGGDLAKLALTEKLVDKLATRDQADEELIAKGAREDNSFRQVDFDDYVGMVQREKALDVRSQVAVVVAEGEILGGSQAPGTVGGDSTSELLRAARNDNHVKAVVLRVNSPGGDAFASELIRREIELIKQAHKPLIVSMGDVAASGGYWISMNGDQIFAEPTTITGSIGIFGLFADIPNTLAKIGVHTDGVGTTALAGAIDIRRPLDPKVGEMIQAVIDKGYQSFINRVAAARHKTPQEIDAIARGRVWTGEQAKQRGLIDELGGLDAAIAAAAQRAGMGDNFRVTYIEKPLSAWERFAMGMSHQTLTRFAAASLPEFARSVLGSTEFQTQLKLLEGLKTQRLGVYAYCFCNMK